MILYQEREGVGDLVGIEQLFGCQLVEFCLINYGYLEGVV